MTLLAAEQTTSLSSYLPLLAMVGLFALFMVFASRQRKKQLAQQQAMYTQLSAGTPVVLTSGFKGTVESVDGENVRVEIAPGTTVTVLKQAVMRVDQSAQTPGDDLITGADPREIDDDPDGNPPGTQRKDN
ncbi:preprotein translocase subunit YajC [Epidermidibacterium keratini]|uniref:Preprotein translocase subunit YajC n=1 Tax=Epidermidibacterium keratini TaxID=1891644 RepID=A0A7L4YI25_9ACTN|nr:preprotein translocase subunit YajC [Epidermidibacterium keratini]QHB99065.1 preprotein translocase subunit YajC [Epidermidibacterium keratini]